MIIVKYCVQCVEVIVVCLINWVEMECTNWLPPAEVINLCSIRQWDRNASEEKDSQ